MAFSKSTLAVATLRLIGLLPLSAARRLGALMGSIAYRCNSRGAGITRENLALCLPQIDVQERERLTRISLQETGKVATEMCVIWRNNDVPVQRYIRRFLGEELALQALADGKGLLILAPHLGNWEVLGLHLASLGKVTNLYQPPKLAGLDEVIRKGREKSGAQLVPTNAKGVAALLKNLKSGGICGILPDQNPNDDSSGDFAPFFGHPAFTMTLVHKLIQRTNCVAVFAFAKRVEGGFELIYRAASDEIYSEDTQTSLAALNRGVEQLVLEAPEQYQWEYKRFKKIPPGGERRYQD
ncbi:MAG: lysophospholipid acyltransferase family protein [Cellvibrionaceae bacterium]|nr:lysophospholipid acyltransferase family protein [Cellvibrionaceae bacterium]